MLCFRCRSFKDSELMKRIGVNLRIQVLSASNSVAYEHWINEPFHRTYNVPEQYGLAREYIHMVRRCSLVHQGYTT